MVVDLNNIMVDCPALDAQYNWERLKRSALRALDIEVKGRLYGDADAVRDVERYKKVYRTRLRKAELRMQIAFN